MTALARISGNCKLQSHPLVTEDVAKGLEAQLFSWKIKILVVGLKELVAKTN
jgi:hypothetical protein